MNLQSEPSKIPTVEEVTSAFDDRRGWVVASNGSKLRSEYGLCALVPLFDEALPKIRNAIGRIHIMFDLIPLARRDPRVVEIAKNRLQDRSAAVRMHACEVLAYSLRHESIPSLEQLLDHPVAETRATAAAAIDAIQHQNHHFYLDREHKGAAKTVANSPGAPMTIAHHMPPNPPQETSRQSRPHDARALSFQAFAGVCIVPVAALCNTCDAGEWLSDCTSVEDLAASMAVMTLAP